MNDQEIFVLLAIVAGPSAVTVAELIRLVRRAVIRIVRGADQ